MKEIDMNIKKFLILTITICLPVFGYTKQQATEITILADKYRSAHTGASVIQSTFDTYNHYVQYDNNRSGFEHRFYRAIHIILDKHIADILSMVKHEYSGHGARLREFNYTITKYQFNLDGSGFAGHLMPYNKDLRDRLNKGNFFTENAAISFAGIESSDLMANNIALQAFSEGALNVGLGIQYYVNANDQINYINITKKSKTPSAGNDIASYQDEINQLYASNKTDGFAATSNLFVFLPKWDPSLSGQPNVLHLRDFTKRKYISFIDPFLWYSAFTGLRYIYSGQNTFKIPMLSIGPIKLLPRARLLLTPFGLSTQIQNYVKYKEYNAVFTVDFGKTANQSYYSFGMESSMIKINSRLFLGGKVFLWRQPELYTLNMREADKKIGLLLAAKIKYKLSKDFSVLANFGYKSRGYVQGEILDKGVVLRGGFAYILR